LESAQNKGGQKRNPYTNFWGKRGPKKIIRPGHYMKKNRVKGMVWPTLGT